MNDQPESVGADVEAELEMRTTLDLVPTQLAHPGEQVTPDGEDQSHRVTRALTRYGFSRDFPPVVDSGRQLGGTQRAAPRCRILDEVEVALTAAALSAPLSARISRRQATEHALQLALEVRQAPALLPNLVDPLREEPAQTGLEQPALALWPGSNEFRDFLETHADALGTVDEGQFIDCTRVEFPVAVGCSSGGRQQPDPLVEADGRRCQPRSLGQLGDR